MRTMCVDSMVVTNYDVYMSSESLKDAWVSHPRRRATPLERTHFESVAAGLLGTALKLVADRKYVTFTADDHKEHRKLNAILGHIASYPNTSGNLYQIIDVDSDYFVTIAPAECNGTPRSGTVIMGIDPRKLGSSGN